jgi:hypothetical protein
MGQCVETERGVEAERTVEHGCEVDAPPIPLRWSTGPAHGGGMWGAEVGRRARRGERRGVEHAGGAQGGGRAQGEGGLGTRASVLARPRPCVAGTSPVPTTLVVGEAGCGFISKARRGIVGAAGARCGIDSEERRNKWELTGSIIFFERNIFESRENILGLRMAPLRSSQPSRLKNQMVLNFCAPFTNQTPPYYDIKLPSPSTDPFYITPATVYIRVYNQPRRGRIEIPCHTAYENRSQRPMGSGQYHNEPFSAGVVAVTSVALYWWLSGCRLYFVPRRCPATKGNNAFIFFFLLEILHETTELVKSGGKKTQKCPGAATYSIHSPSVFHLLTFILTLIINYIRKN